MVNRETITERLRAMEENIVLLEELKSIPFDKFRDDQKTSKCVESLLIAIYHYHNIWEFHISTPINPNCFELH